MGLFICFQDYNNMSKFLNRILGMPVDLQNRLFKYFTDTLAAVMEQGVFSNVRCLDVKS